MKLRYCSVCGTRLSRYNTGNECFRHQTASSEPASQPQGKRTRRPMYRWNRLGLFRHPCPAVRV
jgi:hypothetical protein